MNTEILNGKECLILGCGDNYPHDINAYGFRRKDDVVGIDIFDKDVPNYLKYNLLTDPPIEGVRHFNYVICEHVLEHVNMREAYLMLKAVREQFLRKRGQCIIAVPDAVLRQNLLPENPEVETEHLTFWTAETLTYIMKCAGFCIKEMYVEGTYGPIKRVNSLVVIGTHYN